MKIKWLLPKQSKYRQVFPKKTAEQLAAKLAHRFQRTILLDANHGTKRILVVGPEQFHHDGAQTSLLSDLQAAIDLFRNLRSSRNIAQKWAKSLEEKLQAEN